MSKSFELRTKQWLDTAEEALSREEDNSSFSTPKRQDPSPPPPETLKRVVENPRFKTLNPRSIDSSSTSSYSPHRNVDDYDSKTNTLSNKAERFLTAASSMLTEEKVMEDPTALILSFSKLHVLLRSFRGTYLRRNKNDFNRAVTGGSPFDIQHCEFIVEKQQPQQISSSVSSNVLQYGDSIFLRLSKSELYLSGNEFTRMSRGTWIIRKQHNHNDDDDNKTINYVRNCDLISLEYSPNKRFLGVPALPHDANGSAFVSLEVSSMDDSQRWSIVTSKGNATVYLPPSSFSSSDSLLTRNKYTNLLDSFLGLCEPPPPPSEQQQPQIPSNIFVLIQNINLLRVYCKLHTNPEWGRVIHAFCGYLQEQVLDRFDEFISTLYGISDGISYLLTIIQPRARLLNDWARVLSSSTTPSLLSSSSSNIIPPDSLRGGMFLNHLNQHKLGSFENPDICEIALEICLKPYLQSLQKWLSKGEIFDPYEEFLICEDVLLNESQLSLDYNSKYWKNKFYLREEKYIPWFLKRDTEIILKTGRDLYVINKNHVHHQHHSSSSSKFSENDKNLKLLLKRETIIKIHEKSSESLLQLLKVTHQLIEQFYFLKKFFLLEKGDFFLHFMDIAETELGEQVIGSSYSIRLQTRLQTLIHISLREREFDDTKEEQMNLFLDDLSCILLPYAIDTHVEKIHRNQDSNYLVDEILYCINSFTLDYSPSYPTSIVLTKKVMTKYQLLFRLLFRCKHAERKICLAWLQVRKTGRDDFIAQSLVQRMTHFLQSFEYYVYFEVIEPRWLDFIQKVKSAKEIDSLLISHDDFLDSCLRECLLTNPNLIRQVSKLLRICLNFGDELIVGESNQIRVDEFDQELSIFLKTLTQETEKGQYNTQTNLAIRLDFSDFYRYV